MMGKRTKLIEQFCCAHIRWRSRCVKCVFCVQLCFTKSESSVLFDLTTKSTKKLMVEPSAMVVQGLCLTAILTFLTILYLLRWSCARWNRGRSGLRVSLRWKSSRCMRMLFQSSFILNGHFPSMTLISMFFCSVFSSLKSARQISANTSSISLSSNKEKHIRRDLPDPDLRDMSRIFHFLQKILDMARAY